MKGTMEQRIKQLDSELEKYIDILNELFSTEEQTIERRCAQIIEENYDEHFFLYQSLSHLYPCPQLSEQILSRPSSEPCILLAAFLSMLEKRKSPDVSLFRGLVAKQTQDKTLRFCISGEVSLNDLKRILEHQKDHTHFPDRK